MDFSRPHPTMRHIEGLVVDGFVCVRDTHKLPIASGCLNEVDENSFGSVDFAFVVNVTWSDGTHCCVKRTYGEFLLLQYQLLRKFAPHLREIRSQMHLLPGQSILKNNGSPQVAEEREELLNKYLFHLMGILPFAVRNSNTFIAFFQSRPTDPGGLTAATIAARSQLLPIGSTIPSSTDDVDTALSPNQGDDYFFDVDPLQISLVDDGGYASASSCNGSDTSSPSSDYAATAAMKEVNETKDFNKVEEINDTGATIERQEVNRSNSDDYSNLFIAPADKLRRYDSAPSLSAPNRGPSNKKSNFRAQFRPGVVSTSFNQSDARHAFQSYLELRSAGNLPPPHSLRLDSVDESITDDDYEQQNLEQVLSP